MLCQMCITCCYCWPLNLAIIQLSSEPVLMNGCHHVILLEHNEINSQTISPAVCCKTSIACVRGSPKYKRPPIALLLGCMHICMYIPYTSSVIGRIYNGSVIKYWRSCTPSRSIGLFLGSARFLGWMPLFVFFGLPIVSCSLIKV